MFNLMKRCLFLLLLFQSAAMAQQARHVLFIGNSYTYTNNMPQVIADCALSAGDTLIFDSSTPGGYTLMGHSTLPATLAKIAQGGWDVVVLQEQSQMPALQDNVIATYMFPYLHTLDSLIHAADSCSQTMMYMTWGRKNGDADYCPTWPPVCTYEGMDSLLHLRYLMMADTIGAEVSPAGAVWNYIRQQHPLIDLYQADESHPSPAGTYAAACSFYAALFRKDPLQIAYDFTLSPSDAADIRQAASAVVFDSLATWHIGDYDPHAAFGYAVSGYQVSFTNLSTHADSYLWIFGDGATDYLPNPVHVYSGSQAYMVTLIASSCGKSDTVIIPVTPGPAAVGDLHDQQVTLSIYGNSVNLVFPASWSGPVETILYDATGVTLMHEFAVQKETLNTARLSAGVYLLRCTAGAHTFSAKFVRIE